MEEFTSERQSAASNTAPAVVYVVLLGTVIAMVSLAWLALANTAGAQRPASVGGASEPSGIGQVSSNAPWCGTDWITETAAEQYSLLEGVAVVAENDIWTVGGIVTHTVTEHWDGSTWSSSPSPNAGSYSNILYAAAAISANDIWAVGAHSESTTDLQTLTEHWNGTAWTVVSSPNLSPFNHSLTGLAAISSSDVWAAGNYRSTSNGPSQTLVEHWNGTTWSVVTSPNVGTADNALSSVAGTASNNIWAVGNYVNSGMTYTLVERWNGTNWSVVTSPNVGTNSLLDALAIVTANDIWAVGNNSSSTLVEHWDGIGWSVVPSPNVGTAHNTLQAVAAASANDIWAVGNDDDNTYPQSTLVEHWNGSTWSVVSGPSPGSLLNILTGIAVVSANDVWAVGAYDSSFATPFQPLIERYNPCTPSPTPGASPTTCSIQFSDVPQGSTFYSFIRCLACLGLINGYPDGTFKPNNNVTRGQLSKIVSNAAGFNENQTTQMFQDVAVGSTFFQYIGRLASRGFISGYPCGGTGEPCLPPDNLPYFRPNSQATRGQISKIVSNAAGFNDNPTGQQFQDVLPGSTYYTYTYRLVSRNVMSGYPCGAAPAGPCLPPDNWPYFVPNNNATRGQTSKIVSNTFFPDCNPPER